MPEEEAESLARKHIKETFYRGGTWPVISLDAGTFRTTLTASTDKLSLKDAWNSKPISLPVQEKQVNGNPLARISRRVLRSAGALA